MGDRLRVLEQVAAIYKISGALESNCRACPGNCEEFMMKTSGLNVLLIEDNNGDAELIREMLCSSGRECSLKRAERLSGGLKLLEDETFDVLLLDLGLPDSIGVYALVEINKKKQELPVIVFTGREDDELAARAISLGAQDYLLKGRIDSDMLYRSITYSINRKQAEETIRKAKELSEALNGINSFINSTLDADEIMQRVVARAARLTGADGSSIGLFQDDHVFMKYVYNMPSDFFGLRLTPGEAKHIYYIASRRESLAINDTAADDRIDAHFFSRFGIFSVLAAPLIMRNKVIGAICFYCLSRRCAFTEIYVDFAQKLSTAVSAALENARLYESVKKMDEEIRHLAYHDALTGLPNRRLFNSLLTHEVAQSRRRDKKMAIFFLDLDRFKDINDTLGHDAGDELLKEVADRLKSTVRECDTIARIGGDEFNIILADIDHVEVIADIAQKIVECFRQTFMIAEHEFHMSTSIGISIYPDDSEEISTLLRYADIAMYHAKKVRNIYQFYDPEINVRTIERMQMNNLLLHSVKRGELTVHYQPRIDIKTKDIVGAEALVRWNHPVMGLIDAAQFIPLAEETGFVASIDEWVLRNVCEQVKLWQDAGLPASVTVNLSARQLQSSQLVAMVSQIFDETGVTPECLHLEITESVAMHNIERTAERLNELSGMGVQIYIDDFGTGYSSLNYLKRLPIECLKIDKSFIRDIEKDSDDRTIISAVTAMAHKMKLKVIAEGVETEEQFSFLRSAECDEVQGFLFSRPLPAENFEELIGSSY